jgi:hypothetical protein
VTIDNQSFQQTVKVRRIGIDRRNLSEGGIESWDQRRVVRVVVDVVETLRVEAVSSP